MAALFEPEEKLTELERKKEKERKKRKHWVKNNAAHFCIYLYLMLRQ